MSEVRAFDELIVLIDNLLTVIGDPDELDETAAWMPNEAVATRLANIAAATRAFGPLVETIKEPD